MADETKPSKKSNRQARLPDALRENLRRRKVQARNRALGERPEDESDRETAPEPATGRAPKG
jgi:hypothetical protein